MNFDTLEYEEIAAKLKNDGWAIKYIWSKEHDAFKAWLSERHGIAAIGIDGGFSFWVVDKLWKRPLNARSTYDAWYIFGDALELDPDITPERIGFARVRPRKAERRRPFF